MGRIYGAAKQVIAWLGDRVSPLQSLFTPAGLPRGQSREYYKEILDALGGNEYGQRLWVIQEFLLAKELSL